MKRIFLVSALFMYSLVSQSAGAQLRISFNANISSQPVWGPVGYNHVEYYYLPDIDAFYYVPGRQYVYYERNNWVYGYTLPARYSDYDINNSYKVVVNEPRPYRNVNEYRTRYGGYKGNHTQQTIRNSHDSKYFEIKDHPEHNRWMEDRNRNPNRNSNGNGRGNRNGNKNRR